MRCSPCLRYYEVLALFGMAAFSKGERVRHIKTKELGHVIESFLEDDAIWYRVATEGGDAIEEWEESQMKEEPAS